MKDYSCLCFLWLRNLNVRQCVAAFFDGAKQKPCSPCQVNIVLMQTLAIWSSPFSFPIFRFCLPLYYKLKMTQLDSLMTHLITCFELFQRDGCEKKIFSWNKLKIHCRYRNIIFMKGDFNVEKKYSLFFICLHVASSCLWLYNSTTWLYMKAIEINVTSTTWTWIKALFFFFFFSTLTCIF